MILVNRPLSIFSTWKIRYSIEAWGWHIPYSCAACHLYFRQTKSGKKYSAQILGWTLLLDKDILCSRMMNIKKCASSLGGMLQSDSESTMLAGQKTLHRT